MNNKTIRWLHHFNCVKGERSLRVVFFVLIVLSALALAQGYAAGTARSTFESHLSADGVADPEASIVEPREGITVVATDSNSWRGTESEGPRARAELVAFGASGNVVYYNDTHTRYWDVDPVPGTDATVEYMYADHLNASACPSEWDYAKRNIQKGVWDRYEEARSTDACTRNGFERVNLTTGEVTRLWTRVTPGKEATRYHDADRLNQTHIAVADIFLDRVMVVDTTSGRTEWVWNASDAFPRKSGGPYTEDWTHVNDVEVLPDGRIAASLRNHDQVVFLNRSGLVDSWTLGEDDNLSVLYEQHNPDYISAERGGPAMIVADSENNRLVEYQRDGDGWRQTWVWRDARLQWPRDADRLPNAHTLVADSNGNRVFELDREGNVIWSVNIAFPYEVERLETGDESTDGPSAVTAELPSQTGDPEEQALIFAKQFIPGKYLNGMMYVTPVWMGLPELMGLVVLILSVVALGLLELHRIVELRKT